MANACIASGAANLADAANFTASSAELFAPASNLLIPHVEEQWIGLGGAGDWLRVDLLTAQAFDTIAIMGLAATAMRLRLSTADPEAGDIFDSNGGGPIAINQVRLQHLKLFGAAQTARYIQFDLTGAPAAAGRVFVGTRWQFTRNFAVGWQERYVDPSIVDRASGAQSHVFVKQGWRALDVTFPALTRAQDGPVVDLIDRECGRRRDILFVNDPDSADLASDFIWGLPTDVSPAVHPFPDGISKQYQIEQRR